MLLHVIHVHHDVGTQHHQLMYKPGSHAISSLRSVHTLISCICWLSPPTSA